jgi:hypothetical protein
VGGGRGGEAGEQKIRSLGDPFFSSPRLLFSCVSGRGFDKNSVLGSAVHQGYLTISITHAHSFVFCEADSVDKSMQSGQSGGKSSAP